MFALNASSEPRNSLTFCLRLTDERTYTDPVWLWHCRSKWNNYGVFKFGMEAMRQTLGGGCSRCLNSVRHTLSQVSETKCALNWLVCAEISIRIGSWHDIKNMKYVCSSSMEWSYRRVWHVTEHWAHGNRRMDLHLHTHVLTGDWWAHSRHPSRDKPTKWSFEWQQIKIAIATGEQMKRFDDI